MTSVSLNTYVKNQDYEKNLKYKKDKKYKKYKKDIQYYININNVIKNTGKYLYFIGCILLFLVPYYNLSYVFYILPWLFIGYGLFLKSLVVIYKKYKKNKNIHRSNLNYGKSYVTDN